MRECCLLRHFRGHENVLTVKEVAVAPHCSAFTACYIITDLMDTDLHRIIRSPQTLSCDHIKFFMYQVEDLLEGLGCKV